VPEILRVPILEHLTPPVTVSSRIPRPRAPSVPTTSPILLHPRPDDRARRLRIAAHLRKRPGQQPAGTPCHPPTSTGKRLDCG